MVANVSPSSQVECLLCHGVASNIYSEYILLPPSVKMAMDAHGAIICFCYVSFYIILLKNVWGIFVTDLQHLKNTLDLLNYLLISSTLAMIEKIETAYFLVSVCVCVCVCALLHSATVVVWNILLQHYII